MISTYDVSLYGILVYQCAFFAVFFLFRYFRNNRDTSDLFLFTLFGSSTLYFAYSFNYHLEAWNAALLLFPFFIAVSVALLPVAYCYIASVLMDSFSFQRLFPHLVPAFLVLLISSFLMSKLSPELVLHYLETGHCQPYPLMMVFCTFFFFSTVILYLIQFLIYAVKIVERLDSYKSFLYDHYSYEENLDMNWAYTLPFLFFLLFVFVIIARVFPFEDDKQFRIFYNGAQLAGVIFWGISGIQFQPVLRNQQQLRFYHPRPIEMESKSNNALAKELYRRMRENKYYRNPKLTINDFGRAVGIHPQQISRLLNREFGQNFFTFINSFRVEELKSLLAEPDNDMYTIEGLARQAWFNSRATMHRVFKDQVGISPSEFRDRARNNELDDSMAV